MNSTPRIVQFRGPVRWETGPGSAGLTLIGDLIESQGRVTPAQLSLLSPDLPQLPSTLSELTFEARTAQDGVLRSGAREWVMRGTWQLHRDVGAAFFAAVPPRPTPRVRRFGWRILLAIAGVRPGRWLLQRLSGAA